MVRKDSAHSVAASLDGAAAPKMRDFAIAGGESASNEQAGGVMIKAGKEHVSIWRRMKVTMAFNKMGRK